MIGLVWSIALAAVGITGLWIAGTGRHGGWAVGLAAQALWVVYALMTRQYGFLASAAAYAVVYARNFLRARRLAVPIHVRVAAALLDLRQTTAKRIRKPITIERRIRIVHPDWTRDQVAAEADLVRRTGGIS